jgi:hypothetical protein
MTSKKNIALATMLAVALTLGTPLSASTRDGDVGRARNPIDRIVRLIKKIFAPITVNDVVNDNSGASVPHP